MLTAESGFYTEFYILIHSTGAGFTIAYTAEEAKGRNC
jgi:hypothetical protein